MAKKLNSFNVGKIKIKVGENDSFAEERNYFNEDGNLCRTEAEICDGNIIETVYDYDEKGNNTRIFTTRKPKIQLITSKGKNPALNPSIEVILTHDEEGRLVEVTKDGVVAETFKYAKTGRITHESFEDNNHGVCTIKEVTDKDGEPVSRVVKVNGYELAKFSRSCVRGVYSITNKQNNGGALTIQKTKYTEVDGKQILKSSTEIESAPGFRRSKEIVEIRYNDNNDIEYMKIKEVINGTVMISEQNCIYKNGKLHSIVNELGQVLTCYYTSNRYEVMKIMPQDLTGMLNHLYDYKISKTLKKAEYQFVGNTKDQTFRITHKTKDELMYNKEVMYDKNGVHQRLDVHVKKDGMALDVLNDGDGSFIIVVQNLDKSGKKVLNEMRYMSSDRKAYDEVLAYAISEYLGEIDSFVNDMKGIVK